METSFGVLLWSIFGRESTDELTVNFNPNLLSAKWSTNSTEELNDFKTSLDIITVIGYALYGIFCILTLLVLLNICIAMMSDTYTRVKENIDIEWRFVRTTMWLEYITGPVLPPPYNTIPTPAGIYGLYKRIFGYKQMTKPLRDEETKMDSEYGVVGKLSYEELLRLICVRYIRRQHETLDINIVLGNDHTHEEEAIV